jgi:hypothetical protein
MVTSFGKPIVIVVPAAEVSISFEVPPIVRSCVLRSIEIPVPFEPDTSKVVAIPVNCEPSPSNEPLNEPLNIELAPDNWIEVVPDTTVPLSVKEELTNAAPFHFVTALVFKAEAPETATVVAPVPL